MSENNVVAFKNAAKIYLSTVSLEKLRSYGRNIGVSCATAKKKDDLIEDIIKILAGELAPIEISKKGAPVKNDSVDPRVENEMCRLKNLYFGEGLYNGDGWAFDFEKEYAKFKQTIENVTANAPQENVLLTEEGTPLVIQGQLQTVNQVSLLLPLNCVENEQKIIVPILLIRKNNLQEGDALACHVTKSNNVLVATDIISVNECRLNELHREPFEDAYRPATARFRVYDGENSPSLTSKFVDWLIPLMEGQRGLVLSAPKSGKTSLMVQIAKPLAEINPKACVFGLLVGATPETIAQWQRIFPAERLVYTDYNEDPEKQVFAADFILKRVKRYAECGRKVVLFVDSFNALARAYDDTDASLGGKQLPCGLESKTVQYLKRFFGAARCLQKGGALTIYGSISVNTGNPADDFLGTELRTIANLEIALNDEMAIRRVFPALDLRTVRKSNSFSYEKREDERLENMLLGRYLPKLGAEELLYCVAESKNKEEFAKKISDALNDR